VLKSAVLRGDLPSWLVIPSVTINNRETRFLRGNCLKSRWVGNATQKVRCEYSMFSYNARSCGSSSQNTYFQSCQPIKLFNCGCVHVITLAINPLNVEWAFYDIEL